MTRVVLVALLVALVAGGAPAARASGGAPGRGGAPLYRDGLGRGVAGSVALDANRRTIRGCITAAAHIYRLPPAMLVILLDVEGGSLGRVSPNTNDTVDIGPMQVNQIWIPDIAAHWHAGTAATFLALRDSFCANVEAGAWILRQGLDEAQGDFWRGVGYYHSHDPGYRRDYLRAVLAQVMRLRALASRNAAPARVSRASSSQLALLAQGN